MFSIWREWLGNYVNSVGLQSKKDTILIISVTQHITLNKPHRPCEESPSYDFTICVKMSIARKTGCKPSWDVFITKRMTTCSSLEQLEHFEAFYEELYNMEQKDIFKTSGCAPPCKVVDTKVKIKGNGLFGFILASTDRDRGIHLPLGVFTGRVWRSSGLVPWILLHHALGLHGEDLQLFHYW